METRTAHGSEFPWPLGSVLCHVRQHRLVSEMSQQGGEDIVGAWNPPSLMSISPTACTFPKPHCARNTPPETCIRATCQVKVHAERGLRWPVRPRSAVRVCGVWLACLSLGLVRRASRVCWGPVAHLPPHSVSTRMARPFSFCDPVAVTVLVLFSSCGCVASGRWMC